MNPRVYRWQLGIILLGMFALIPAALAQTAPTIDEKDKVGNSVPDGKLQQLIDSGAAALAGADVEAREDARESLIAAGTSKTESQKASPAYLDQYADKLNKALKPLATNANNDVRLNVAIVVAKVARSADNTRLLETVQILLTDKTDGVKVWALRAARYVLPAELRVPGGAKNDKLIPAIVALTKNGSGFITSEAYNALSLNYTNAAGFSGLPAPVVSDMFNAVVPPVHSILRARLSLYAAGSVNEPSAEKDAANFLVNKRVWESQDAKTKTATLQVLHDLVSVGAQTAQSGKNPDIQQAVRDVARAMTVPYLSDTKAVALRQVLDRISEPQNMKPWEQVPALTAELIKIDKNVKPTSAPTSAPAGK